jgi:hypothetical protein
MGTRTVLLVALTSVAACASAGAPDQGEQQLDANNGFHPQSDARQSTNPDAPQGTQIDAPVAPPVDAPSTTGPHTLSATATQTDDQSAIACSATDQTTGETEYTDQNSYYRVFPLADFGITTAFHVTNVDFVVEDAEDGPQTLTIKVGTYSGTPGTTLTKSDIVSTQSATQSVADGDTSEDITIANDIAAGGIVLVEVDAPSGKTNDSVFYMGATTSAETEPSYISSTTSDCDATSPTKLSTLVPTSTPAWLLTVTGTTN